MRWQDKLTAKELFHLKDNHIKSLKEFKVVRGIQTQLNTPECRVCTKIAEKLGVVV